MVVVLPAPLGPSKPKHSPRSMVEIEAVDRIDRHGPGGITFTEVATENGGNHGDTGECPSGCGAPVPYQCAALTLLT